MRITLKQLKNLDVETLSGTKLGHVFDLVMEIDEQFIAQYEVRSSVLSTKNYLISRDQVVRFESGKMVVDDSVALEYCEPIKEKTSARPEPAVMREEV
ncbi:PRC-barrel domain-containing protein [Patescibacteria group bacterium]|nr:PRC-barrel domain-containing protein [Patescibacteria group bacterium]MBU1895303.1 PRC-barrel domain-containing protein [Patescibacteria group bacterium]